MSFLHGVAPSDGLVNEEEDTLAAIDDLKSLRGDGFSAHGGKLEGGKDSCFLLGVRASLALC